MTRKIAIVGSAGTKQYAPWNDRNWELWSLNHIYWNYDRTDRHFDIHNPVNIRKNKAYLNWLVGLQEKVMLAAPMPEMPRAMIFPQKEIMERFGDYFNNSISWMIALALYEGVDEIGVYGVELTQKIEYERQRPSVPLVHCERYGRKGYNAVGITVVGCRRVLLVGVHLIS